MVQARRQHPNAPLTSNRTPRQLRRRVLHLRRKHRWGADHIAQEVGLAASTVGSILRAARCARLVRGDRARERPKVRRINENVQVSGSMSM